MQFLGCDLQPLCMQMQTIFTVLWVTKCQPTACKAGTDLNAIIDVIGAKIKSLSLTTGEVLHPLHPLTDPWMDDGTDMSEIADKNNSPSSPMDIYFHFRKWRQKKGGSFCHPGFIAGYSDSIVLRLPHKPDRHPLQLPVQHHTLSQQPRLGHCSPNAGDQHAAKGHFRAATRGLHGICSEGKSAIPMASQWILRELMLHRLADLSPQGSIIKKSEKPDLGASIKAALSGDQTPPLVVALVKTVIEYVKDAPVKADVPYFVLPVLTEGFAEKAGEFLSGWTNTDGGPGTPGATAKFVSKWAAGLFSDEIPTIGLAVSLVPKSESLFLQLSEHLTKEMDIGVASFEGELQVFGVSKVLGSIAFEDFAEDDEPDNDEGKFFTPTGLRALSPPIRGQVYVQGEVSDAIIQFVASNGGLVDGPTEGVLHPYIFCHLKLPPRTYIHSQGSLSLATGVIPGEILRVGVKGEFRTVVDFDPNTNGFNLTKDALFYIQSKAAPELKLFSKL